MLRFNILICAISLLTLSACQNVQKSSRVIAQVFDTSTHFQQFLMDKHAPDHVVVYQNIAYQTTP